MRNAKDSLDARLSAEDDFAAAADWNHVLAPESGNARANEPARRAARDVVCRRSGLLDPPDDVIHRPRDGGERAGVELVRPEEGARMDDGGVLRACRLFTSRSGGRKEARPRLGRLNVRQDDCACKSRATAGGTARREGRRAVSGCGAGWLPCCGAAWG